MIIFGNFGTIWNHQLQSLFKCRVGRLPNHTELCWTEAVCEHVFVFFVYEPAVQRRPKNQALCKKGVLTQQIKGHNPANFNKAGT